MVNILRRQWLVLGTALVLAVDATAAEPAQRNDMPTPEQPFLAENQVAMDKMMAGMDMKPSGDVDRDFALMMIAHHQGAIEMAEAELRHGRNEHLRRIAQEIVVDQQQEIAAMRLSLGELPSNRARAPDPSSMTMPEGR